MISDLQRREEGLLGNLHRAHLLHPPLAFLLLLEQFAFAADVTTLTFRRHVFSERADRFGRDGRICDESSAFVAT